VTVLQRIAAELGVGGHQVRAAVDLLDGGATVPFIARYRKEATGALDDAQLRTLEERLRYLRELEERRGVILESIRSQGKLDDALQAQIMEADSKARLEDIYLPFKPKRRTKAQIAREAGLQPLADALRADPAYDVSSHSSEELDGARAIIMEEFSEDADLVGALREVMWQKGHIASQVREGKREAGAKFADYFDFAEPFTKLPSHRILALFRGEKEEVLDLTLDPGDGSYEERIATHFGCSGAWLLETVRLTWRARILLRIGADLRGGCSTWPKTKRCGSSRPTCVTFCWPPRRGRGRQSGSTRAFAPESRWRSSTRQARSSPPTRSTRTCPRTSGTSPSPRSRSCATSTTFELVAIGNGTASRETDKLGADLIKKFPQLKLIKVMVSEAGASVYSASAYASQELPSLDVSLRGAVSIARRLQDPLAELVKIDPKSIGVGQYQHDLSEIKLSRSLDAVVEDAVNAVGVDVNTASVPLLTRVSGIGESLATNIVAHRDSNGPFRTREAIKGVPRLGPKAFEQCAGFLRIPNGDEPLDRSGVHPEAYPLARRIMAAGGTRVNPADFVDDQFGLPTIKDILRSWTSRAVTRGPPSTRPPSPTASRRSRTSYRGSSSKASSRTWPRSGRSSTSACTRMAWSTSPPCRAISSRTPAKW
jgi:uncharacterized protein